ncbi:MULTISPECIES: TetR/AcrR family transcriptional regulator [Streptomyces]|uniref:HTH tetR-type domain-containing protein n=1 Tax=Streptomyces sanyensis TaxID=568869 RepID=A0ABP9A9W5_9ACTN
MTPEPSGRPATAKGLRRRAELLDAAERLLSASGGAQLTLRAVADEAGVRLGHLQHYFPSRAELVAALLDRVLETSLARIAERTGPSAGADPASVLDAVLGDHDDAALVRLFTEVWSMAAHDPAAAAAVRSFYAGYVARLTGIVRHRVPGLGEAAARARAEVFVMTAEGSALFRSGIAGARGPEADAVLRRTLLGLLTGPASP